MKELLEQAINGDGGALREIYSKYNKPVYYFCLKLMPSPSDAAEMCAETFDCAFARLETLENPDQFDIWLKNIAAIRCYNLIHKQKPMLFLQAVADTEECLFSEAELEEMPQGELEETRTCQLMDKMLDRLNDDTSRIEEAEELLERERADHQLVDEAQARLKKAEEAAREALDYRR